MLEGHEVAAVGHLLLHPDLKLAVQALRVLTLLPLPPSVWNALSPNVESLAAHVLATCGEWPDALEALEAVPLVAVRNLLQERLAEDDRVEGPVFTARSTVGASDTDDPISSRTLGPTERDPGESGQGELPRVRRELEAAFGSDAEVRKRLEGADAAELCVEIHAAFADVAQRNFVATRRSSSTMLKRSNAIVSAVIALGREFVPDVARLHTLAREHRARPGYSLTVVNQLAWAAVQPDWRVALEFAASWSRRASEGRALGGEGLPPDEQKRLRQLFEILVFLESGGRQARRGTPIRRFRGNNGEPDTVYISEVRVEGTEEDEKGGAVPLRIGHGSPRSQGEASRRIVSTGFSRPSGEDIRDVTLRTNASYRLYVEISAHRATMSIDDRVVDLPVKSVPAGRRLRVSLFTFVGELLVEKGEDFGDFEFREDGCLAVCREPGESWRDVPAGSRLKFKVRTSLHVGQQRLRCNIYLDGVLLISKLVHTSVAVSEVSAPGALWAASDYVFAGTLDPMQLRSCRPHVLSIMLNDNGNGTHGFRFQSGQDDFKSNANLQDADVSNPVSWIRSRLCVASWGCPEELPARQPARYRYAKPVSLDHLMKDLLSLARAGRRAWDALVGRLSEGGDEKLRKLMIKPGRVQVVSRDSPRLVVPAALFYDRPPRSSMKDKDVKLCGEFERALDAGSNLEEVSCFRGECPNLENQNVLCPSGFWGFRHRIGMPYSIGSEELSAANVIFGPQPLNILSGVATDLQLWRDHLDNMKPMGFGCDKAVTSVEELLSQYSTGEHQLVYLYGHGGLHDDLPYFAIGEPGSEYLLRDSLQDFRPSLTQRPLVFLNGCHSVGLAPNRAVELVSGFVQTGRASGVIGTEISVFEPLAVAFAELCLHRFVVRKQELGEAVLGARLDLLRQRNPLGLVYIPYAPADLRIVSATRGAS